MVPVPNSYFLKISQCFEGKVETFLLKNNQEEILNVKVFMEKSKANVLELIQETLRIKGNVKLGLELFAELIKYSNQAGGDEQVEIIMKSFKTPMERALQSSNIDEIFCKLSSCIDVRSEVFVSENSGWSLFLHQTLGNKN